MSKKAHGTTEQPVQENLRWGVDQAVADKICCYNRVYAERSGYWKTTEFLKQHSAKDGPIEFRDSVSGQVLFTAPKGRSWDEFVKESTAHGWPSFRNEEVNWDQVGVLENGETVSVVGTHLGHNLPDSKGDRYCINLVCVAGNAPKQ